jgi:hypothetical protein
VPAILTGRDPDDRLGAGDIGLDLPDLARFGRLCPV